MAFVSNITPDAATGIGTWTADDFWRAMHEGRSRDGRRLVPAFPYTSYTRIPREDSDAIFAYLRSVAPVRQASRAHELRFPFGTQAALAAWQWLYFTPGAAPAASTLTGGTRRVSRARTGALRCVSLAAQSPGRADGDARRRRDTGAGLVCAVAASRGRRERDACRPRDAAAHGTQRPRQRDGSDGHRGEAKHAALVRGAISRRQRLISPRSLPRQPRLRRRARQPKRSRAASACISIAAPIAMAATDAASPARIRRLPAIRRYCEVDAQNLVQVVRHGTFGPVTAAVPRPYGMPPQDLADADMAALLTWVRQSWGNAAAAVATVDVARMR